MQKLTLSLIVLFVILISVSCNNHKSIDNQHELHDMVIRVAEIEIDSNYLDEYTAILQEEAEASVRLEPGVICIYPMLQKDNPTQVRILEIYARKDAYDAHLKTPHFLKYKTTTNGMVKSLRLIDMNSLDSATMALIFTKLKH